MKDKNKDLAIKIAQDVKNLGGTTYYVGGYVRDEILGIPNKDIDIEIHGITPKQLKDILQKYGHLNTIGNSFGIYNLNGYDLDIAMPRKETANGGGGHKDFEILVDPFCGVEAAAKRRDFTINAIYKDVLTGEYIDFFHGIDDLEKRIIRMVDEESFKEDPLRVLRGCGFAARFLFRIDSNTKSVMRNIDLTTLPKERVFEEFKKVLLKAENPYIFVQNLCDNANSFFGPLIKEFQDNYYSSNYFEKQVMALYNIKNRVLYDSFYDDKNYSEEHILLYTLYYMIKELPIDVQTSFIENLTNDNLFSNYINLINKYINYFSDVYSNPIAFSKKYINKFFYNIEKDMQKYNIPYLLGDVLDFIEYKLFSKITKDNFLLSEIIPFQISFKELKNDYDNYKKNNPLLTGKNLIDLGLKPSEEFSVILNAYTEEWFEEFIDYPNQNSDEILKDIINSLYKKGKIQQNINTGYCR